MTRTLETQVFVQKLPGCPNVMVNIGEKRPVPSGPHFEVDRKHKCLLFRKTQERPMVLTGPFPKSTSRYSVFCV